MGGVYSYNNGSMLLCSVKMLVVGSGTLECSLVSMVYTFSVPAIQFSLFLVSDVSVGHSIATFMSVSSEVIILFSTSHSLQEFLTRVPESLSLGSLSGASGAGQ